MWHVRGDEKYMDTRFSCGTLRKRNPLGYLCADVRITNIS
jgi:hypothetical protein